MHLFPWRLACIAAALGATGTPLVAQNGGAAEHVCTVFAGEADKEGLRAVRAGCWGTGIDLGQADEFQVLTNHELGATLVGLSRFGSIRILLLRERADGQPMVEDISSALSQAAGRGPLGNFQDLPVDFTRFETTGAIGIGAPAEAEGGEEAVQGRAGLGGDASAVDPVSDGQLDIGAFIQNDPAGSPEQSEQ